MKIRHAGQREEKSEIMMTPMIDIVFQLLIFFIMTFKIVAVEGDFNVNMPTAPSNSSKVEDVDIPPLTVRMVEDGNGNLKTIIYGQRSLGRDFGKLRQEIRKMFGDTPGPSELANNEVELDCDYNLNYENVIEAITAVSGYPEVIQGQRTGKIIKTVEKIKFAPPRGESR